MARSCILSEERLFTANDGTNKFCSAHRMSGRNVLAQKTPLAHLAQIVHFADFLAHISEHLSFTENTICSIFACLLLCVHRFLGIIQGARRVRA